MISLAQFYKRRLKFWLLAGSFLVFELSVSLLSVILLCARRA